MPSYIFLLLCLFWPITGTSEEVPWAKSEPILSDSALLLKYRIETIDTVSNVNRDTVKDTIAEILLVGKANLKGMVISSETQQPLEGVSILLKKATAQFQMSSDKDGLFQFKQIEAGDYNITVFKKGFEILESSKLTIHPGNKNFQEIMLDKKMQQGQLIKVKKQSKTSASLALLQSRQKGGAVVDGVNAEQISKSTDSDAGAVAKRVSGTSVVGGKFVYIRGIGERYTNMTFNGLPIPSPEIDKRVVPQDLFPASIIESFSIYKTFSPDLPGDFGGGSVALVTKGIPEKNFNNVSIGTASKDYIGDGKFLITGDNFFSFKAGNPYARYFGYDDGTLDIPEGVPTKLPAGQTYTEEQRLGFAKKFNSTYMFDINSILPEQKYSLSLGRVWQLSPSSKNGFLAAANFGNSYDQQSYNRILARKQLIFDKDFNIVNDTLKLKNSKGIDSVVVKPLSYQSPCTEQNFEEGNYKTKLSALLNYGFESRNHILWAKSFYANLSEEIASRNISGSIAESDCGNNLEDRYYLNYQRRDLLTLQAGGGSFIGLGPLDSLSWGLSWAKTANRKPDSKLWRYDWSVIDLKSRTDTTLKGNFYENGKIVNEVVLDSGDLYRRINLNAYRNVNQFGARNFETLDEDGYSGRLDFDFIVPPSVSRHSIFVYPGSLLNQIELPKLKAGIMANAKSREVELIRYNYGDAAHQDNNNAGVNLVSQLRSDRGLDSLFGIGREEFETSPKDFDQYTASEYTMSYYGNFDFRHQLISIPMWWLGGMRSEIYHYNIQASAQKKEDDIDSSKWEISYLPSFVYGMEILKGLKTQFLFSKTIVRPEISERIPLETYSFENGMSRQGMSRIKSTPITNWDIRVDYVPLALYTISASVFYKNIKDPVLLVEQEENEYWTNAVRGWLRGVEFESNINVYDVFQKLNLNWNLLKGIQLYGNAAFIQSKIYLNQYVDIGLTSGLLRPIEREKLSFSMPGQSPYLYNAKITHETKIKNWELLNGFLYNVSGMRLSKIGVGTAPDVYEEPFHSLDYLNKIGYKGLEFKFSITNLLNQFKRESTLNESKSQEYQVISDDVRDKLFEKVQSKIIVRKQPVGVGVNASLAYKF